MARKVAYRDISQTLAAADKWIKSCLVEDNSVFSPTELWTKELVEELHEAFVEHIDNGGDSFMTKLKRQIGAASPASQQLMAEMLWILLLFPSNINSNTKRQHTREIWELSGQPLDENHPFLADDVLIGIGSGGPAFNNLRPLELEYLIVLTRDLKLNNADERRRIFSEYDPFMEWIDTVPRKGDRQFRHMLRFFAFPHLVERMSSNQDRRSILEAFKVGSRQDIKNWTDRQLDDALFKLRSDLQKDAPSEILDFYDSPWKERWKQVPLSSATDIQADEDKQTTTFYAADGDASTDDTRRTAGPRFVRYFGPVLDGLRDLGGEAAPREVIEWIRNSRGISNEEREGTTKSGGPQFDNRVGWARFYLVKAGLIDGKRRGVWALTDEGRETTLNFAAAMDVFKSVRTQFVTPDDEEQPAPEPFTTSALFDDPNRKFWFVGANWNRTDDQTERFISEGIWQNGYDDELLDEVRSMQVGDRIAIKASFVRKYKLPFENAGRPVSCMRMKAIGTIFGNSGDGKTIQVDWEPLNPPREWYLYTYRSTVHQADPADEYARRLIQFTFAGAKQDLEFWLNHVPYFAQKYPGAMGKILPVEVSNPILEDDDLADDLAPLAALPYSTATIIDEGGFIEREYLDRYLERLKIKKNLILQGPPGTGKTWLATRLAYALLGTKDRKVTGHRLRTVQFHPSLSYEDFVRGWRPDGSGKLTLIDGVFLEMVFAAIAEPDQPYVLIIEEINRGNPAQVFGELLTLLEDTKRQRDDAIELSYRRERGERVYIPKNLHVIGTMNIADRSLALVDLALRRRFAFVTLEPALNTLWRRWCVDRCGFPEESVTTISDRMAALNVEITGDRALGTQFQIGHSYATPQQNPRVPDAMSWFRSIVETEIVPLLHEYWFDAPDKVEAAKIKLLNGL